MPSYHFEVQKHFTEALMVIQSKIQEAQEKYKQNYDKSRFNVNYKVGDMVWKESETVKRGQTKKLRPIFDGPYKIIKITYPNVMIENKSKHVGYETIHVNRTKPFNNQSDQPKAKPATMDQTMTYGLEPEDDSDMTDNDHITSINKPAGQFKASNGHVL
uniref:Uncharacterized protein n=1 Tax=Romanomermis culicivorax TaxID=13658 RepID=A0A915HNS6_ROMCU